MIWSTVEEPKKIFFISEGMWGWEVLKIPPKITRSMFTLQSVVGLF